MHHWCIENKEKMSEKIIGFKIRIEGTKETIDKLSMVELELAKVAKEVQATKKALTLAEAKGDSDAIAKLTDT